MGKSVLINSLTATLLLCLFPFLPPPLSLSLLFYFFIAPLAAIIMITYYCCLPFVLFRFVLLCLQHFFFVFSVSFFVFCVGNLMATAQPIANIFQIVLCISYFSSHFPQAAHPLIGPISSALALAYCHKLRQASTRLRFNAPANCQLGPGFD